MHEVRHHPEGLQVGHVSGLARSTLRPWSSVTGGWRRKNRRSRTFLESSVRLMSRGAKAYDEIAVEHSLPTRC